jgi:hypothetical protein
MNDFRQYEEAIALYHNKLSINTAPVYSWDFHNDFLCSIKNFFFRFKQNGIAAKNKWVQSDWDLKQ